MRAAWLLAALVSVAGAQTPAPVTVIGDVPATAWNEADLTWPAPTEYAAGGTLADPADLTYIVEVKPPGGTIWAAVAIVAETHYHATNLSPGQWAFRVRSRLGFAGFSVQSPQAVKVVIAPPTSPPPPVTQ